MNYNFSEITYPSKDGKNTIYAEIYTPKIRSAKGIIQLAHGMIDYVERYKELADYLTGEGYIFAGNHHLGHGKSAACDGDFGIFTEDGDGIELLIGDMHTMNKYLRETFPTLPLVVMGHSMGSFITRLYVEKHPHSMQGVIIHGTGGPNPLVNMGITLAKAVQAIKGPRHRSRLIKKLAFGSYNSKFTKQEGQTAWLTREADLVSDRKNNKYMNFTFTVSGYIDLFRLLRDSNSSEWFKEYPKELPTLIMSGDMDPVGNYGKGPDYVYKRLLIEGCKSVELKMYEGARHELFLESNRAVVFADIVRWVESVI
jgi:alpha-beta hydrolase superfamily lysophospholipase